MIMLQPEIKTCMAELLLKDTFDRFAFIEGEITTYCKFSVSGYLQPDFFDDVLVENYASWSQLREYCFSIIKGKRTPLHFKLIYALSKADLEHFLKEHSALSSKEVQGLYLNFSYNGSILTCTTGTSFHTFTMDRSLEHLWDQWVKEFFSKKSIPCYS